MKSICEWSELLYKDVTETPNIIPVTDSYGNGEHVNIDYDNIKISNMKIVMKKNFEAELYCSTCSELRNTAVKNLHTNLNSNKIETIIKESRYKDDAPRSFEEYYKFIINKLNVALSPSLWEVTCLQCKSKSYLFIYTNINGQQIIHLSETINGVSTPNTPYEVSYYLDQAHKSKIIGANSAAVVMYRTALEHLLYNQGYTKGMLNAKINELENGINRGTAPRWALNLDVEILKIIKDLGNGAAHTNKGDITKQYLFDSEIVNKLDLVFKYLLEEVYEIEIKRNKLVTKLKDVRNQI